MPIKVKSKGDFKKTETFLLNHRESLFTDEDYIEIAEYGLQLLKKNTPTKSGKTADSWSYEISEVNNKKSITYSNSNIQNGLNIAILVDTGHATSSGNWIPGEHYIDETIKELCSYINKKK